MSNLSITGLRPAKMVRLYEGLLGAGPVNLGDGGSYATQTRLQTTLTKKLGRWTSFTYDELIARDKTNLDIFWLKDESLEDTENLPAPDVLAQKTVEQLEAALEEFRRVEEILANNT